jgi:hypothetical protein
MMDARSRVLWRALAAVALGRSRASRFASVTLLALAFTGGAAAPSPAIAQDTLSLEAPRTVTLGRYFNLTYLFSAAEATVGIVAGEVGPLAPCPPQAPSSYTNPTIRIFPQLQRVLAAGSGRSMVLSYAGPLPGKYRFCAWLTALSDGSPVAGPASVDVVFAKLATQQSYVGQTSQERRFGLAVLGATVTGFDTDVRLACRGTEPPITTLDPYDVFTDQLHLPIAKNGSFSGQIGHASVTVRIRGVVSSMNARGTLATTIRPTRATKLFVRPRHRLLVNGACSSTVRFTASHAG